MAKKESSNNDCERALIPSKEQLYGVPKNWCWTRIGSLVEICLGLTHTPKYVNNGIPFISVKDMSSGYLDLSNTKYISEEEYNSLPYGAKPQKGDILFARVGTIGVPQILDIDIDLGMFVSLGFFRLHHEYVSKKYICYWMDSVVFEEQVLNNVKGSTLKNLNTGWLKDFQFPLPPLKEQQRIVNLIDDLFYKLDEAKEKAQGTLDSFEETWSAISYAAFSGKLTEEWRERNGISFQWKEYSLQEVCSMKITDGTHQTPKYCEKEEGGIPFISAKDVTSKEICWDNIKYIVPELHEELYSRIAPQVNDVLLAKNGTTGVAAIVETDRVFDIYVTIAVLRPNVEIVIPRYLYNIVNSPVCKDQFNAHLTGIGVPNLHLRDIKEVKILVPEIDEQKEVVRIVDGLWKTYESAIKKAQGVIEDVEMIKKSILAKAFRGELGTNDPSEESSVELLKQIIES